MFAQKPSGKYTAVTPIRLLQEVEGKWAVRHEVEGAAVYERCCWTSRACT